eukprot:TRINITY_DN5119_c0_g1_i1.p1 TRINITY_DN5119_c0_g1~~TRINITY_DN5119_c0_g1_i1.p1  ORF type:complete len:178 (+),score=55.77 TRINITY_DN5119_c0_g1_i1:35-535(+)
MAGPVTVRKAIKGDAESIVEIVNESYLKEEKDLMVGSRTNLSSLIEDMNKEGHTVFVLEEDGKVIGSILFNVEHGKGHFGMLSIKLTHQKRGLSKLLVERAEQEARDLGLESMEICIIHLRESLQSFYKHLDYSQIATIPFPKTIEDTGYVPKKEFHMLLMEKKLR